MTRSRTSRAKSHDRTVAPPRTTHVPRLAALLLVAAGVLVYANSLTHPFLFDDAGTIVTNEQIRHLDLARVFAPPPESPVAGRPLVNLSFAINYALGGLDPVGYHVWNLAVHLLCGLLVFGIVGRLAQSGMTGATGARNEPSPSSPTYFAFAVALLWVVHPLNSEAVDYVTERTESMMALFYLLTIYASVRAWPADTSSAAPKSSRAWLWPSAAVIACALGMLCKESMVTAPVAVLLLDRVFAFDSLGRAWRARWRLYSGLAATWGVLLVLARSTPRSFSAGFATTDASPWTYLLDQAVMLTRYLRLTVWPRSLVLYYGWTRETTLAQIWPYALLIVALLGVALVTLLRRPKVGVMAAWCVLTLAPTSSVVPIASEVGAERRMYLPLIGLVALAVLGARWLWERLSLRSSRAGARWAGACALVVVASALGWGTIARNRDYASPLTMAETVLARWPTPVAEDMVGWELASAGRHEEAIAHLRAAADAYAPARFNLGSELLKTGQIDEGIAELTRFVAEEPTLVTAHDAKLLIGQARVGQSRWSDAVALARAMLAANPGDMAAEDLLASASFGAHDFAQAIAAYQRYLAAEPNDAGAEGNLGIAYVATGRTDEALAAFERQVELDPRNPNACLNLTLARLDHGDAPGAIAAAQQAVSLAPTLSAAHGLLGHAYLAAGRPADARVELERALQLDSSNAQARDDLKKIAGE